MHGSLGRVVVYTHVHNCVPIIWKRERERGERIKFLKNRKHCKFFVDCKSSNSTHIPPPLYNSLQIIPTVLDLIEKSWGEIAFHTVNCINVTYKNIMLALYFIILKKKKKKVCSKFQVISNYRCTCKEEHLNHHTSYSGA